MTEYKKFTVTRRHGIDDLKSYYPYPDSEWDNSFMGSFGWTEEEYKADRKGYEKLVQYFNDNYIAELKEKGEYGKEWQTHFNFATLPEFDDNKPDYSNWTMAIPLGKMKDDVKIPTVKFFKDDEL